MPGKIRLMAHLVAGYPDASGSAAIARGLVEGGAAYLEVQIPFSDPSADGPAIMDACSASLAQGYTVADAFKFVGQLHGDYPSVPIFIMSYASLAVTPGVEVFVSRAKKAGATGLIIPDLPFDSDEGLDDACREQGLCSVPVAAPSMRPKRLSTMAYLGRPYLYAALRAGITGAETRIGEETRAFLEAAGAGNSRLLGGFGIRNGAQALTVAPYVHAVVAGSVFVEAAKTVVSIVPEGAGRDELLRETVKIHSRSITQGGA